MCVVTQDETVPALVREAIKGAQVEVFSTDDQLIDCALRLEIPRFVFIDMTSIADGVRLIHFIKSSPVIARILVVAIANVEQAEHLGAKPDAVLYLPLSANGVAELVTRLGHQGDLGNDG